MFDFPSFSKQDFSQITVSKSVLHAQAPILRTLLWVSIASGLLYGCATRPNYPTQTRHQTAPEFYTVRAGESLSMIAQRYGLDYRAIARLNGISNPNIIHPNQRLRLRGTGSVGQSNTITRTTQPIIRQQVSKPTYTPSYTPPPSVQVQTPSAATYWQRPSQGAIIAQFNPSQNIKGTRFAGNIGDPILAASDGEVVYADNGLPEYGQLILIRHAQGYITAYAHNSKLLVKVGDQVKAGQRIAEMGNTGTTRTQLEFQVRLNGTPIDPASLMQLN